jgi:uncharacterized protein (TIGR00297 family)
MMPFLYGFLGSWLVAFPAFLKKKLSSSGLIGALFLGTLIYGFGTFLLWLVMIIFFLSSTFISNKSKRRQELHGRTYIQVFANGGVALLFATLYYLYQLEAYLLLALISFSGSNADTWGSEIGTRYKGKTFYITTFQAVPSGISGGVSIIGTFASMLGSLLIATVTIAFLNIPTLTPALTLPPWQIFLLILGMGFLNTILDSYFGALLQAKYRKHGDSTILEVKEKNTRLVAGLAWINNDAVNFLATFATAIIAGFFLLF